MRDTSLKVPHGEGGVVIDVKTFRRDDGDDLPPGVNDLVRVFRGQEAQDLRGRQARGPSRQQGRDLDDRPGGTHAVLEDGTARRRDAEPARGAPRA